MRRGLISISALGLLGVGGYGMDGPLVPHHMRRGVKSNRYPRGSEPAMFNTREDGERAIRRAKRWLKHQSRGSEDVPPRHIFQNAELAAFQFPELVPDRQ